MAKQAHVSYEGRVQGVGFRFTAVRIAHGYDVTGFVRNLWDGRVELVAEGEEQELRNFLSDISGTMREYITNETVSWDKSSGRFKDFSVRFQRP